MGVYAESWNGTIAAMALTSAKGGENGYGSLVGGCQRLPSDKSGGYRGYPKGEADGVV